MRKLTLGTRLTIGGVLAVVVPLAIIGAFAVMKASEALTNLSREQAATLAVNLADITETALSRELKVTQELSLEPTVIETAAKLTGGKAEDAGKLDQYLAGVMQKIGSDYESIVVANPEGVILADGGKGEWKGINISNLNYFKAAKEGKATVGNVVKSKKTGSPVVPIGAPLLGADGKFVGSIASILKLDFLVDKISQTKLGKTGYAFMADSRGLVIAHPKRDFILELDLSKLKGMETIVSKMMGHNTGVEFYTFEGIPKIAGFAPVALTGWSICTTQPEAEFLASAHAIRNGIFMVGGIFLALTVVLVLLFARSISRPITRVVEGLNEGADQVASASGEVASSSQQLAEGASEQAASIEETSASLEEMSSMTKQNAGNANEANRLMADTSTVVSRASHSMGELTTSMAEISKASEETSKIIRTIDEIAFQTNLLALNAAVEAARAGEAGAGFAVVADEVRNLAMRAADAAKNTASLIEGTVKRVKAGSEILGRTSTEFLQVASSSGKMTELVGEIAAASNEQARGIEQINIAVGEMDKVVQQNAANAEESASASVEMNAQVEQMKGFVEDLMAIVGGKTHGTGRKKMTDPAGNAHEQMWSNPQTGTETISRIRARLAARGNKGNGAPKALPNPGISPEHLIPFDDAEVRDF